MKKIFAWLQLLRFPNLFTVPGDVWVGYALASLSAGNPWDTSKLVAAIGAVALAYAGGLVQNDLVDIEQDEYGRTERPLVTGRVKVVEAGVFVASAWGIGLGLSWSAGELAGFALYLILLSLIVSYNVILKERLPHLACLVMGLCRGTSLLFGAVVVTGAAAVEKQALLLGALLTFYISAVTWIAAGELYAQKFSTFKSFLPTLVMATIFLCISTSDFTTDNSLVLSAAAVLAMISIVLSWRCGCLLHAGKKEIEPKTIMRCVGISLRLLIPMQLTILLFCSRTSVEAGTAAVVLGVAGLFNQWSSRWIAQT